MATKLGIYNGALRKLGEPRLSALTDDVKGRHVLDAAWSEILEHCLEQGLWNFATRSVQLENTPSLATEFGYTYVFDKPDDWVRTAAVSLDEFGAIPLLRYEDRTDYWLCDHTLIYVWYISNDDNFGLDLGRWPETFAQYVQYMLAYEICEDVTGSETKKDRLERRMDRARRDAKNKDASNEAVTRFPPTGSLLASRGASGNREGRYRAG